MKKVKTFFFYLEDVLKTRNVNGFGTGRTADAKINRNQVWPVSQQSRPSQGFRVPLGLDGGRRVAAPAGPGHPAVSCPRSPPRTPRQSHVPSRGAIRNFTKIPFKV
ncbi:hypothetical protein GWI33_012841 [Rhynchophorus ferrugineus]|uniref:Uncharacterized protein n=1 Tax=Rhynchophorus ferrugineus TaxID=354439 RepID=A0A834I8G4_RHYFE|nr:hypothetical protein GWI33_012841 [Rhynchophorus ferrugineus]